MWTSRSEARPERVSPAAASGINLAAPDVHTAGTDRGTVEQHRLSNIVFVRGQARMQSFRESIRLWGGSVSRGVPRRPVGGATGRLWSRRFADGTSPENRSISGPLHCSRSVSAGGMKQFSANLRLTASACRSDNIRRGRRIPPRSTSRLRLIVKRPHEHSFPPLLRSRDPS